MVIMLVSKLVLILIYPKGTDSTNKLHIKITISDQSESSGSIVTVIPNTTPNQAFNKLKETIDNTLIDEDSDFVHVAGFKLSPCM